MAQQVPNGMQQFIGGDGIPLAGGSVTMYQPLTTTPVNTYQDAGLSILNTNPVILDANGMASIWVAPGTQVQQIVTDSLGNQLWNNMTGYADPVSTVQNASYAGPDMGLANAYVLANTGLTAYTPGTFLVLTGLSAANTGACTVAATPLAALPIVGQAGDALAANVLATGGDMIGIVNGAGTGIELVYSSAVNPNAVTQALLNNGTFAAILASLQTNGNATIGGNLSVAGTSTLTGAVAAAGTVSAGGLLTASGGATISGTLTIDGVVYAPPPAAAVLFGTVTDETANRAFGPTYTNSTGKPMMVQITGSQINTSQNTSLIQLTINGIVVGQSGVVDSNGGVLSFVCGIVPDGGTYQATNLNNSTVAIWVETS